MYWQRRLPHWVPDQATVFLTWRLAGTLPQRTPALLTNDPHPGATFVRKDRELDRTPLGPRWFKDPRIAAMFVEALFHGEAARGLYDLYAWVVMPNHVHLVLKPNRKLPEIMRRLKAATANRSNLVIGKTGTAFWQREYFDRWIRSEKELCSAIYYVEQNPVTAGLVVSPEDWPFSSAAKDTGDKIAGATLDATLGATVES